MACTPCEVRISICAREPGAKKYFGFRVGGEYILQSLRQIKAHRSEQGATDNG